MLKCIDYYEIVVKPRESYVRPVNTKGRDLTLLCLFVVEIEMLIRIGLRTVSCNKSRCLQLLDSLATFLLKRFRHEFVLSAHLHIIVLHSSLDVSDVINNEILVFELHELNDVLCLVYIFLCFGTRLLHHFYKHLESFEEAWLDKSIDCDEL